MNDNNFNGNYRPPEDDRPTVDIFPRRELDLKLAFSSGLFLALCIIITLMVGGGLFTGVWRSAGSIEFIANIDIIGLLITIGMWITYAGACDASRDSLNPTGLSIVSGCLKAMRIVLWVFIGIAFVVGLVVIAFGAALETGAILDAFNWLNGHVEAAPEVMDVITRLVSEGFASLLAIMVGVVMVLTAVVMLIFNLTFYRSCHRLARSMAEYAKGRCDELDCARGLSVWLLVIGIIVGLSAMTNMFTSATAAMEGVSMAAMYILGSVFLKQYFVQD